MVAFSAFNLVYRASGQSLYQVLGLPNTCTSEDIKKAYRKVVSYMCILSFNRNCSIYANYIEL